MNVHAEHIFTEELLVALLEVMWGSKNGGTWFITFTEFTAKGKNHSNPKTAGDKKSTLVDKINQ